MQQRISNPLILLFVDMSTHLSLQRFTGCLVWIKSQKATMHSWERDSCFVWEDPGESEESVGKFRVVLK